jgi:DNA-binding NarL/FixJ family response regulator
VRVVVADDAVLLREGLARLLAEAGFEIVGLAADAEELLALVERTRPAVAIVDIRMPPTHTDEGLQAARLIRERWPEVGILVLSQHVRASYAVELLAQGSAGIGYLLKERVSDLGELAASVERVARGDSVLDPLVVEQLVGRPRHGHDPLEHLTERERDVLALMAEGRRTGRSPSGWSSPSTRSRSTSSTSSPACVCRPRRTTTGECSRSSPI